jgi:hypothetical protein
MDMKIGKRFGAVNHSKSAGWVERSEPHHLFKQPRRQGAKVNPFYPQIMQISAD